MKYTTEPSAQETKFFIHELHVTETAQRERRAYVALYNDQHDEVARQNLTTEEIAPLENYLEVFRQRLLSKIQSG